MQPPKQIISANEVLGRAMVDGGLGRQDGMARYQWLYSKHIQMPQAVRYLSDDGKWTTELDYWCNCGRNVRIHAPQCQGLTVAKSRWEWANLVPSLDDHWVLCRWLPPNIWGDERKWHEMFWGAPYPAQGFYLPTTSIGRSGRHISVPNSPVGLEAFEKANQIVIKAFQFNADRTGRQDTQEFLDSYKEQQKKDEKEWAYTFKSAMSCTLEGAGKKSDWVSFNLAGNDILIDKSGHIVTESSVVSAPVAATIGSENAAASSD